MNVSLKTYARRHPPGSIRTVNGLPPTSTSSNFTETMHCLKACGVYCADHAPGRKAARLAFVTATAASSDGAASICGAQLPQLGWDCKKQCTNLDRPVRIERHVLIGINRLYGEMCFLIVEGQLETWACRNVGHQQQQIDRDLLVAST